jgi:hypothetical protein
MTIDNSMVSSFNDSKIVSLLSILVLNFTLTSPKALTDSIYAVVVVKVESTLVASIPLSKDTTSVMTTPSKVDELELELDSSS